MANGRLGKCKDCTRADVAANRERRRDYYLKYDRRRLTPSRKVRWHSGIKKWQHRHAEARRAQTVVNNAIRDGRLVRGIACEFCRATERLHAHHDDYSKPLEVRWLCIPCHRPWHASLAGKTPWRLKALGVA